MTLKLGRRHFLSMRSFLEEVVFQAIKAIVLLFIVLVTLYPFWNTVVVSFKTVGTLLVFGLLIAPAASASLYSRKVGAMMLFAWAFGALAVYLGLLASYYLNLAGGASIALASTLLFFALLQSKRLAVRPREGAHA